VDKNNPWAPYRQLDLFQTLYAIQDRIVKRILIKEIVSTWKQKHFTTRKKNLWTDSSLVSQRLRRLSKHHLSLFSH